jgi:hypothetical protein
VHINVKLENAKDVVVIPSESMKVNNMGKHYLYQVRADEASATKHQAKQIYRKWTIEIRKFRPYNRE